MLIIIKAIQMAQEIKTLSDGTQKSNNLVVSNYETTVMIKTAPGEFIEITKEQISTLRLMLFNIQ